MSKLPIRRIVKFASEHLLTQQKEAVFGALLKNYLFTKGFVVATPEPDLGDDLWIAKKDGRELLRVQLKSIHTSTGDEPGFVPAYNASNQTKRLLEKVNAPGCVYVFGMADYRFHGLAVGRIERRGGTDVLRTEPTRVFKEAPAPEKVLERDTKSHVVQEYSTETRGFHFGCIPSSFFRERTKKWVGKPRGGIWIKVFDEPAVELDYVESFRYEIDGKDVTRFFGQITAGWEESMNLGDT